MCDPKKELEINLKEENITATPIKLLGTPTLGEMTAFVGIEKIEIFEIVGQYFRAYPCGEKDLNKAKWYKWEKIS